MDLVRLKSTRGDWLRTSGVVGVLAVNWAEFPVREGSVQERYTESAVGLSVALAALLLVAVTANFAESKLLARLAFFFKAVWVSVTCCFLNLDAPHMYSKEVWLLVAW